MNTELNKKYCVGLGEILFDVLPTGSQLGGAPANFAYHAGSSPQVRFLSKRLQR